VFLEAKDDGGGGNNWTTGAISCAKLQSNHHHQQTNIQFFLQLLVTLPCHACHQPSDVSTPTEQWEHNKVNVVTYNCGIMRM